MPPLGIEVSARFKSEARALTSEQLDQIDIALGRLPDALGQPHRHSGLGLRRLKKNHFEFRIGRDMRVVFKLAGGTATLRRSGATMTCGAF